MSSEIHFTNIYIHCHIYLKYMCNETEKHQRWKRYRYFIASLSFSTTIAPVNRLSVSPLGNQCSQLPTCPCELVPGLDPQTHGGPSLGEHWGVFGGEMEGGDGVLGVGSRTDVHSWWARGWVASGRALSHVLSLLVTHLDPALCQPPHGSIPELGGGRAGWGRSAGHSWHTLTSVCKKWEGGGHTGLVWLSAREERKEQEGLKINVFVLPY